MRSVLHAPQAALAGRLHAAAVGIVGIDFADQEHLVAAAGDRLAHHFLGAALAVHLGGVDQRHAEVQAQAQRRHLVAARADGSSPMFQVPWPSTGIRLPDGNSKLFIRSPLRESQR
jgi:hypothetical protein